MPILTRSRSLFNSNAQEVWLVVPEATSLGSEAGPRGLATPRSPAQESRRKQRNRPPQSRNLKILSFHPPLRILKLCNRSCLASTLLSCAKGGEFRMGKKLVLWSGVALFVWNLALTGCEQKQEPPPPPPAPAPAAPGPAGPAGQEGAAGAPGAPGAPGATGAKGQKAGKSE